MSVNLNGLRFNDTEPVYQQVINYFKKQILLGNLNDGDEVPSRRMLAALLGINPTTVQRIYKELESENLIITLQNSKSLISVSPQKVKEISDELVEGYTRKMIMQLKSCNVDFKDMIDLINRIWDEC